MVLLKNSAVSAPRSIVYIAVGVKMPAYIVLLDVVIPLVKDVGGKKDQLESRIVPVARSVL
jgi:hypothetical protein